MKARMEAQVTIEWGVNCNNLYVAPSFSGRSEQEDGHWRVECDGEIYCIQLQSAIVGEEFPLPNLNEEIAELGNIR
jgi:hypothetical protein